MNTRQFLTAVWPAKGPYCIATPWTKPDSQKQVMAHRAFNLIDDAMTFILKNKASKNLYFAPHTLKVARELNPATGKMQTFRTHENMCEAQAFFFDIDAGGPKDPYATQDEILSALEQFLFETCLPSPFVINSGYGIHVHWIIDAPIESVAWTEPAARLYWLAQQHRLHVDPSRTTDQSSVLRVPGTFNLKDSKHPRKVEILAEGAVGPEFLTRLNVLTAGYDPSVAVSGPTRSGSGRGNGMEVAWDGRHPPADEVADVCEHMKTFRDSQGNIPEPAWHVGIGTIKHCDDGQDKAHEWSSGYPGYTMVETQAKLDAWILPPPSCGKIDKNSGSPSICARCPVKDLAKNPVLIANVVYEKKHQPVPGPAATSTTPSVPCLPPEPYSLDMTSGVMLKKTLICDWPMFPISWVRATLNEQCLSHWMVKPPLGHWERIEILNDELEQNALGKALRNKCVITTNLKHTKTMHHFMLSYLNELRKHQDDLRQYDFVGWETEQQTLSHQVVELGDPDYFILYEKKIRVTDGAVIPCVMTKNTHLDGMGQRGSLAQQIALMDFYNKPQYMAQQFAIACSLATPFFRYTNQHGVLVVLVGDTGSSKSTGAFFAASLWGHPERYCASGLASNSTDKARQERETIMRNLPFIVDEITLFDPAVVNEIALAASQLGGRDSLTSNRNFRAQRGGYKANLTICTSNTSLMQKINATNPGGQASLMRIFEIKVAENDARSKREADAVMRQLIKNYGWIGEDFLRRCLPHRDALGDKFMKIMQELEMDIKATARERFMTAAAAAALFGIKLGNKLGYFKFSYKAMREWLINVQIPAMRNEVEHERAHAAPETILHEYLESIGPNIYRINKNSRGETEIIYAPPIAECKARYEIARGEVFVRIGPFKDYCNERHHNYSDVIDHLYRSGLVIIRSDRRRMHVEANTLNNPVACFIIKLKSSSPVAVPNVPEASKIVEFKKNK